MKNNNIDIRKENPEDQECFYGTEDAVKLIDDMNLLAQSGIDFFTSAGNDGKDYFNLFQLAENIHGVGSLDARGKISSFSSSRKFPLTFHYELGEHRIKKTKEGINYTGGNHTDFICDLNDYYPLSGKSATGRIVSQKEFERYLYYSQTDNKKKGELLGLWKKQGKLLSEDLMLEMNDEESEINRNWVYYDINGLVPYVINKNNILEPYLGWVDGTSFAAPKRTARYALNKAMEGVL